MIEAMFWVVVILIAAVVVNGAALWALARLFA